MTESVETRLIDRRCRCGKLAADDENGSACVDQAEYQLYRLGDAFPRPDGAR